MRERGRCSREYGRHCPELSQQSHQSHGLKMKRGTALAMITTAKNSDETVPINPRKCERSNGDPPSSLPSRAFWYCCHDSHAPPSTRTKQTTLMTCST